MFVYVLSCPVLSCPVLSCPVLSCPVLFGFYDASGHTDVTPPTNTVKILSAQKIILITIIS